VLATGESKLEVGGISRIQAGQGLLDAKAEVLQPAPLEERLGGAKGVLPTQDTLLPELALSRVPDAREVKKSMLQHEAIVSDGGCAR